MQSGTSSRQAAAAARVSRANQEAPLSDQQVADAIVPLGEGGRILGEGQVTCFHYGAARGTWVGPKSSPITSKGCRGTLPEGLDLNAPMRCPRCRGPVVLERVEPVMNGARSRRFERMREPVAELQRKGGGLRMLAGRAAYRAV